MFSLFSFIALVPLAISAARVPHNLLDTSIVTDTTAHLSLNLGPRTPAVEPYNLTELLHNASLEKRGGSLDGILPNIQLGVSFCLTLAADLRIYRPKGDLLFYAGTCLCVDADVETGSLSAGVKITSSSGITVNGHMAERIRNAMLKAKYGLDLETNILIDARANICLQVDLFVKHTQHDFSRPSGPSGCCARTCQAPFVPGPGGSCVCPSANKCGKFCLSGPALLCDGSCHLASEFTCKSGYPQPNPVTPNMIPIKRSMPYGRCGYEQEHCPVATSAGWECVNTKTDMESCGGCVHAFGSAGKRGQDCTTIPYVNEVMCNSGSCLVKSCEQGYSPVNNGTSCALDITRGGKGSNALRVQSLVK